MTHVRLHTFTDDALGRHDAVALARLIRRGELGAHEVREAAIARARRVDAALSALVHAPFDAPVTSERHAGAAPFGGVPTFVKDTEDVRGWPTRFGSEALPARPARRHGLVTRELLAQGFTLLGKTQLPEFGLSAATEFARREPTKNPWHTGHTSGGSSGGSAALVAAGVVPIAHGNDGGGSLRIPASCCGLVGLKTTRGRFVLGEAAARMPLTIVSEGVLSRSVRDTAHFVAAAERGRASGLPPVGLVEGPDLRRLRVGLVIDSVDDMKSCPETRALLERVGAKVEALGHRVEPLVPPVPSTFIADFKLYWGLLATGVMRLGPLQFPGLEPAQLDGLTRGLARYCERRLAELPGAMARLSRSASLYARAFAGYDAVLSPVVSQVVPELGHLNPELPFEQLFDRIVRFSAFTPLNNAAGSPAISVPAALSQGGLPMGVQLSGAHGDERTLLALAYELEAELAFPRIDA